MITKSHKPSERKLGFDFYPENNYSEDNFNRRIHSQCGAVFVCFVGFFGGNDGGCFEKRAFIQGALISLL